MRPSRDCLIVGDDPAACLIALALQRSGLRAALVTAASTNAGTGHWLIPTNDQAVAWPHLAAGLPELRRFVQRELLLERIDDPQTHGHVPPQPAWLIDAEDYAWECRGNCRRQGVEMLDEIDRECAATIVLKPLESTARVHPMVWGNYRQVSRELGPQGGTAFLFASRTGARWWLIPQDDELTSVGVQLSTSVSTRAELRNAWEDELVACPQLVERLFDAQLVGSLQSSPASQRQEHTTESPTLYQPCSPPSPLARPWEALSVASVLAGNLVPRLRRTPVF